jgi:hypothetical protein
MKTTNVYSNMSAESQAAYEEAPKRIERCRREARNVLDLSDPASLYRGVLILLPDPNRATPARGVHALSSLQRCAFVR